MYDKTVSELNFIDITVAKQIWEHENSFSYIGKSRPNNGICFVLSGNIRYISDKKQYFASAGDIVLLPKSSRYKAIFSQEALTSDILINFFCDNSFVTDEIAVFKNRFDIQGLFSNALGFYLAADRRCMLKAELYRIFDALCSFSEKSPFLTTVSHAMSENPELKEPELAKICAVSVSTFQRLFLKNYGKAFSEYKSELKMIRAKELLSEGRYSMEEIAEALGFCDSSYFSKCFKRTFGISPKKYLTEYYRM